MQRAAHFAGLLSCLHFLLSVFLSSLFPYKGLIDLHNGLELEAYYCLLYFQL